MVEYFVSMSVFSQYLVSPVGVKYMRLFFFFIFIPLGFFLLVKCDENIQAPCPLQNKERCVPNAPSPRLGRNRQKSTPESALTQLM